MNTLLDYVFSNTGLIACLLLVAIRLYMRPPSTATRRVLMAIVSFYVLSSIYAIPYFTGYMLLVRGFHKFSTADLKPQSRTAVVLLGGGGFSVRGWDDGGTRQQAMAQAPESVARVLEAVRVFKLIDPPWVISSGGNLNPKSTAETSAVAMRDLMVRLGVPASRIILEDKSGNTHDEAVLISPMLRELGADSLVLVTSDIHMRRSMGTFQAQGMQPIPAIAPDPRHSDSISGWIIPNDYGFRLSLEVVHELIGIPYYASRGWLKFPGNSSPISR